MCHFVFTVVDVMFKGQQELFLAALNSLHTTQARTIWMKKYIHSVTELMSQWLKYMHYMGWGRPDDSFLFLFQNDNHIYVELNWF